MTLWPRIDAASSQAAPSTLWSGFSATSPEAANAPPVDLSPAAATGVPTPPLDPVAARAPASRPKHRTRILAVLTLFVSTGLHAAVLTFFLDRMSRAGIEAETDAVSVEIVLEAPSAATVAASGGALADAVEPESVEIADPATEETPAPQEAAPQDAATEVAQDTAAPSVPDRQWPERPVRRQPSEPEPVVEEIRTERLASPPAAVPTPAPIIARDPVAELTPPLPAEPAHEEPRVEPEEKEFAEALTPEFNAPIPSPRPDYTPPAKAKPQQKAAAAKAPAKQGKADKAEPVKTAAKAEASKHARSAGSKGGASAGAQAKYGQKLLSHVQRHKRYPEAAARQKITGATKLAITIDRSGKLAGAKVSAGSGHAILDEEAVAVARRAAPYPRPPDGVGGNTISFSVTLRFAR